MQKTKGVVLWWFVFLEKNTGAQATWMEVGSKSKYSICPMTLSVCYSRLIVTYCLRVTSVWVSSRTYSITPLTSSFGIKKKGASESRLFVVSQLSSSTHVGGASSQLQHGAGWPAGIPVLTPLHSQSATLGHSGPHASTSRGSAVSALLTHGSTHTGTTLLIPKTEKLSPVQLYGADRSSLTGAPRPECF